MGRDQPAYNAAYYARNRDREIERVTRRQRAARDWLRELRRVPCMDCEKWFEPHVMDFDHRDRSTKRFNVAGRRCVRERMFATFGRLRPTFYEPSGPHRARIAQGHSLGTSWSSTTDGPN